MPTPSDTHEIRALGAVEIRAASDGASVLSGYAAIFDTWTEIGGMFRERIARGAFAESLANKADVRALVNHDPSRLVGRTRNGSLTLREDDHGLAFELRLPSTQYGAEVREMVASGLLSQMSIGFMVKRDCWKVGQAPVLDERTVESVDLLDVSIVTFPAYQDTSVAVRSRDAARAESERTAHEAESARRARSLRLLTLARHERSSR